jgi:pimeloyl-ACP methyl ester carboxylesterase
VGSCERVRVPFDWSAPEGERIEIFVDRVVPRPQATAQLFLVQGGPGLSVQGMLPLAKELARAMPQVEIILFERRGVGLSHKLECPSVQTGDSFLEACAKGLRSTWGPRLAHFGTEAAARDLVYAAEHLRAPGQQSFMYGVSYGTALVQRAAWLRPELFAGAVLDSTVTSEVLLSRFDAYGDAAGARLAQSCSESRDCVASVGQDPVGRLQRAKTLLQAGHCPEANLDADFRVEIAQMLRSYDRAPLALVALSHYERCTPASLSALGSLRDALAAPEQGDALSSLATYLTVGFSELWETPAPNRAEIDERFRASVFPTNIRGIAALQGLWPTYAAEPLRSNMPGNLPVLMLSGGLDPQTPEAAAARFAERFGARQTWALVPAATHGVAQQSPYAGADGHTRQCGQELIAAFVGAPEAQLDLRCTLQVPLAPTQHGLEAAAVGGGSTATTQRQRSPAVGGAWYALGAFRPGHNAAP